MLLRNGYKVVQFIRALNGGNIGTGGGETVYLNFGGVDGTTGYGLRDKNGVMEVKNSAGNWTPFGLESEKSWAFHSPSGASGTFWIGGFYKFAGSDDDFFPGAVTFGTANASYDAHFFVVLGATAVDEITITITGTTVDDQGTRAEAATVTLTIPNGSNVNDYFETPEKFVGQVSVQVTAGTAKTCNYGFAKYWDNLNTDFVVTGVEATWLGGATDTGADIHVHHHRPTGWTFNSGAEPTTPTAIATMSGDHGTEDNVISGEHGAWKREVLTTTVLGAGSAGVIVEIKTTANKTFDLGTFLLRIRNSTQ